MFWITIAGLVGLLVGWNLPQPAWAKYLQDQVVSWFKGLGS